MLSLEGRKGTLQIVGQYPQRLRGAGLGLTRCVRFHRSNQTWRGDFVHNFAVAGVLRGMINHYEVLRVGQQATQEEITESYRLLAQMYHPDRFAGNERKCREANGMMRELNEAYQTLRDPVRRQAYDQTLKPSVPRQPASQQPARSAAQYSPKTSAARRPFVPPQRVTPSAADFASTMPPPYNDCDEQRRARAAQQRSRLPIRTPLDLLAFLLRPFHYIGIILLFCTQLCGWGGAILCIVSAVSWLVMLWLEFNHLLPLATSYWAYQGMGFGWLLIMTAVVAMFLPLYWILKLLTTANPILCYFIAAALIFVSMKFVIGLARHVFGLPKREPRDSCSYCSERLTVFTFFGALWVFAYVHGVLISGLIP